MFEAWIVLNWLLVVFASWVSITVPHPGNVAPTTLGDRDPPFPQPRGIYKVLMRLISGAPHPFDIK